MFDHIRFDELTHSGYKHVAGDVPDSDIARIFYNENNAFSMHYNKSETADFTLTGHSKTILPVPISDFALNNLLTMQVFALFYANKYFYTQRKNFPYYLIIYTYKGQGILEYEGKNYILNEGDGFLIDCRIAHKYRTSGDIWEHFILHYSGHTADWLYEQSIVSGSPIFHFDIGGQFQNDLEHLLLCYQTPNPYREYEVSTLLSNLIMDIIKEKNIQKLNVPDYIIYLEHYIKSNYTSKLSLDYLSSFSCVSKYHLDREFKKYIGSSINEYIIDLRITQACFLLTTTSLPISTISDSTGFSDYHNFLKLFKKRMHMTPNQYRKM